MKTQYIKLFTYLREFTKLGESTVFDIRNSPSQYPQIIWLEGIQNNQVEANIFNQDFDEQSNYWIKIEKPQEPPKPKFPDLPEPLDLWVDKTNIDLEEPFLRLKDEIIIDNQTYQLADFPDIQEAFETYQKDQWVIDILKYTPLKLDYDQKKKDYQRVNSHYHKCFEIHTKVSNFSEQFELIIGVGLLNFKENNDRPRFFRHILTQKMTIDFDSQSTPPKFTINPSFDDNPKFEQDLLGEGFPGFGNQYLKDAQNQLIEAVELAQSIVGCHDNLTGFINQIHPEGKYEPQLKSPSENGTPTTPALYFSPALLLRKKNQKGLEASYEKIIKDLQNSTDDPRIPLMEDMIGIQPNQADPGTSANSQTQHFEDLLFPKPYNEEQKKIIDQLNRTNKVLVQGPPGTGKSHTIANIICHSLAQGKKILVTAKNKRALEVLKDKLPQDFKNLAVNYWGTGAGDNLDLERSIHALKQGVSDYEPEALVNEIDTLEKDLRQMREGIAMTTNTLLNLYGEETKQSDFNEYYRGSLTEIAEQLDRKAANFEWYNDDYSEIPSSEFIAKLERLIGQFDQFRSSEYTTELSLEIPDPGELLSHQNLIDYSFLLREFRGVNISEIENQQTGCKDLLKLIEKLGSLKKLAAEMNSLADEQDVLRGFLNIHSLETLSQNINQSDGIIKRLDEADLQGFYNDFDISYPSGIGITQLKQDGKILLDYLKEGKVLAGFSFKLKKSFLPQNIKECLYFIDQVRVNGSPCDTIIEFESVLKDIGIQQDFKILGEIWSFEPESSTSKSRLDAFKIMHRKISRFFDLTVRAIEIEKFIQSFSNLKINIFDLKAIKLKQLIVFQEYIKEFKAGKDSTTHHPIYNNLLSIYESTEIQDYPLLLEQVAKLLSEKDQYQKFKDLKQEFNALLPRLVHLIEKGEFSVEKIHGQKGLIEALFHKDAARQLKLEWEKSDEVYLKQRLRNYEAKEKELIGKLASKKAWLKTIMQINDEPGLIGHLNAWLNYTGNIPKQSSSKNWANFVNLAKNEIIHCKTAIPCWIMPLYQVVEQFDPKPRLFDLIIVDEASQLAVDAILLYYLGKKIIVVGDNKQTAPQFVGTKVERVQQLMNTHLPHDLIHRGHYDTNFSFFDHCFAFTKQQIMLQQHFRCMPEIIEFSNRNFYDGKLFLLKQYSAKRLEPLKTVFCANGYVEGEKQNIRNQPEAEQMVETIAKLIMDESYQDKTMGVITLQGQDQAKLIQESLSKKIGIEEFQKRKIICGNSASFQGDERDIMFLSLVTAHNHNRTSLTQDDDRRRYNVAASRAKEQSWLFHSVNLADLNPNDLRYKLLDHYKNNKIVQEGSNIPIPRQNGNFPPPQPFDSWFEVDVYNEILRENKNLNLVPQYNVAGERYRIDLVVIFPNGAKLAIECDGSYWHGPEQWERDMHRQRTLESVGWVFFRVRDWQFYSDKTRALKPFWDIVSNLENYVAT